MKKLLGALALAFMMPATSTATTEGEKIPKQVRKLYAMTPEDHAAKVQFVDDDLEVTAEFNTVESFVWKQGILGGGRTDIFLRAFVQKQTGATRFQVYFVFNQVAQQWPRFYAVNFETPLGPQSATLENIGNDVRCGTGFGVVECTYVEHLVFDVTEHLLRQYAATYVASGTDGWDLRFKAQTFPDGNIEIAPGEIAGLLMRVDQYKEALSPKPQP